MDGIDIQAIRLYWLMIWAVVGSGITPLIFDRKNRSPWQGAFIGLIVGIGSGQIFGYLLLTTLFPVAPDLAGWVSMLGGLVLLIPLWFLVPETTKISLQNRGFVAGTITPLMFYLLVLSVFPLLWALVLAFFEYSPREVGGPILGLGGDNPFVGFQHFETMMSAVRQGKQVVGAFYGHPGVFAWAPHRVIKQAQEEGYDAAMLPGISAEDCLFADMGIDPGQVGCQHLEASQLMLFERTLDTAGYVILWQVGVAGDVTRGKFVTSSRSRDILVEVLLEYYPADHSIALYEAKVLPIDERRIDWLNLSQLAAVTVHQHTTLVIPPSRKLVANHAVRARLEAIAQEED